MKKFSAVLLLVSLLLSLIPAHASLTFPANLEIIEDGAFENDSSVSGIVALPEAVHSIGERAFAGTDVYALMLPAACSSIGSGILADAEAAYIYMEEYVQLDDATLSGTHYVFVENGMETSPDEKYIPASSVLVIDNLCYSISEDGLYPLCPFDPEALSDEIIIPKYYSDLPVISLDKLVLPGCEDVRILAPAYMSIPEGMNAESYDSLLISPLTCLPSPPVAGFETEFSATVTENWGDMDYEWTYWYEDSADRAVKTWTTDFLLTITPPHEGNLTVCLTVTDELGDTGVETATFYVEPYVEFTLSDLSAADVYAGSSAIFTVVPEGANGAVSYEWTFTCGGVTETIVTGEPACSYTPAASGELTVSVAATDADGRTAEISAVFDAKCAGISLEPLALDQPLIVGQESTVIVSAQCDCEITGMQWEISGSGQTVSGSSEGIEKIPFIPDTVAEYTVSVTVTDVYGNTAAETAVFTAAHPPMSVSAPSTEDALHAGIAAEFTVETTHAEGKLTYTWIVSGPDGDEAFTTDVPALTYTPASGGEYTIAVTVSDTDGQEASASETFTVSAYSDAAVSVPVTESELIAGAPVLFTVDALSDCDIVSYHWTVSDGNTAEEFATDIPSLSFSAPASGEYTVTVTVTDAKGSTATSSEVFAFRCGSITLTSPAVPETITTNVPAVFTVDASCFCSITGFRWTLEGGGTSYTEETVEPTLTVTPAAAGEYVLTVIATDAEGNTASGSCSFTVACGGITASDIVADVGPRIHTQTVFSVNAVCDCTSLSYQWTLVDDDTTITSVEETLTYTPSETGTCTVTVVITDAAGAIEIRTADFVIENEILYRALLIGNTYPYLADLDPESEEDEPVWVDDLPGPDNDISAMAQMLALQERTPYEVSYRFNATADEITDAITSDLSGADANDISLFYFSGHGTSEGDLCGVENTYISVDELRSCLDTIPGKKIVLLDSCYSGAHIGKSISMGSSSDFNSAVISAFGASKARANLAEDTDAYIVMTACSQKQTSSSLGYQYTDGSEFWFGAFTYALTLASGFDMDTWEPTTAYADYYGNLDGNTSLGEAYETVVDIVVNTFELDQSTQYHGDEDFILWSY